MTPMEAIREVEAHGGRLLVEQGELKVRSARPLPDAVLEALRRHKPAIMVALGEPLDGVVAGILRELRPHLSPVLQRLSDDKLLALVNWHIIAAWERAIDRSHG